MIILIVEDDLDLAGLIKDRVEELGYEAVCVHTAQAAIDLLETQPPYLMILDYGLPDMTGKELIDTLKSKPHEHAANAAVPPFIVSTGQGDESIAVEMMKCGAKDYLAKDNRFFDKLPEVLKRVIREIENEVKYAQAEAALRESEIKYRELVENLPDAIVIHVEGKIVYANGECVRMLACASVEEILGKPAIQFVHPDYHDFVYERIRRATEEKSVCLLAEEVFIRCDGAEIDVEVKTMPIQFEHKPAVQVLFREISERKRAEKAVRESEEKYRILFESFPLGIAITDSSGNIIETNLQSERLLGINRDEHLARRYDGAEWKIIRPDGTLMPSDEYASVRAMKDNCTVSDVEMGILKPNNNITWINVTASPIPLENYGVAVTYEDITHRIESQERLRETTEYLENLFNYASAPIIVWDGDLRITRFNKSSEQLTGRTAAEVIGKRIEILFPADKIEKSIELIEKTSLGERWESIEIEILHVDGSVKVVLWNSANVYDQNQERILATIAQGQDITRRKEYEDQLTEYTHELKRINATKDKLFSIIAHDLRSPFHPLIGITSLLKDNYQSLSSEDIEKYNTAIHSIAKRVFGLLQNLLAWAGTQSGKIQNNPVQINLAVQTTEVLQGSKDNYLLKGIQVVNQIDIGLTALADENMINSVLHNLITNSIKFTPEGGSVTIDAWEDKAAYPKMIVVSIADTGIGIDKERLDNLFDIEKYKTTRGTNQEVGSGLGLSLCKEFVDQLGGKLWAESTIGKGSTFYFTVKKAE